MDLWTSYLYFFPEFPDDKTEYIPAVFTLLIFMIGAVVATILIKKYAAKEEKKWDEQYNKKEN